MPKGTYNLQLSHPTGDSDVYTASDLVYNLSVDNVVETISPHSLGGGSTVTIQGNGFSDQDSSVTVCGNSVVSMSYSTSNSSLDILEIIHSGNI